MSFSKNKIFNLKVCWIKLFISGFGKNPITHLAPTGRPHCLLQPYSCEGPATIYIKNLDQTSFSNRDVKTFSVATHLFRGIILNIRRSLRWGTSGSLKLSTWDYVPPVSVVKSTRIFNWSHPYVLTNKTDVNLLPTLIRHAIAIFFVLQPTDIAIKCILWIKTVPIAQT